jgi:ADP-L-glycero-D-manno-heptose 6-epimerase
MFIVTGGAGFIGSAIIAALNQRNVTDILIVDELSTSPKWKNLRALQFSDYIEKDDFLKQVLDNRAPKSVQGIFHMGACSSTTEMDCSFLIKNNFEYTKHLAQWACREGIRFVYASSAATYGAGEKGFNDDQQPLYDLRPLNPYGYSKQIFDCWAGKTGLLDKIVGLKYFNVFGPNEYHKGDMCSYVLKGHQQIKASSQVTLFKSGNPEYAHGEYVRDFIYIKDAVAMTLFFMDNPELGGLYNVGTGRAHTWNEYVSAIFAALDLKPAIEFVDMPESIRGQYQYYTQANMDKLHQAGYDRPCIPLKEAVADYVLNYLESNEYLSAGNMA